MNTSVVKAVRSQVVCGFVLGLGLVGWVQADDHWMQWRGNARDSVVAGTAWPTGLGSESLTSLWRVDLSEGYPGPIVAGKRVFTVETKDEESEVVKAFHRETGRLLWEQSWEGAMKVPFFAARNGSWVRSTPATDGESLVVAGMRDVLVSLDVVTGRVNWKIDFVDRFDADLPSFGFVSSPLIAGGHVYVQAGGGVAKVVLKSGKVAWHSSHSRDGMSGGAFSSPVLATIGGREQLVVQGREELMALDPKTGTPLWKQQVKAFRGMNIVTPVVYGEGFFTTTYGGKSRYWEVSDEGHSFTVGARWENKLQGYMCTPVVVDDHAYFHLRNQRAACVNLKTGEIAWVTTERFGKYWSMVAQGDRLLALDQKGELILMRANLEGIEIIDRRKVAESETWAHVAVVDGAIYIRELNGLSAWQWREGSEVAVVD